MNRRQLLKSSLLGASTLLTLKSFAQAGAIVKNGQLQLQAKISRNHGHDLTIVSTDDFVLLLRKVETQGSANLSIQGRSRHPHNIEIDAQAAMDILLGKEVTITSTRDAGHTHDVTLKLG